MVADRCEIKTRIQFTIFKDIATNWNNKNIIKRADPGRISVFTHITGDLSAEIQNMGILKSEKKPKYETIRLGWHQNTRIFRGYLKCEDTQIRGIPKMRGYLNSWDIKGIFEIQGYLNDCCTGGSGSFSVQVSSRFWCGGQGSLSHSSANVTPFSCSSASVSGRNLSYSQLPTRV